MKKNILFLIFLTLLGCASEKQKSTIESCPSVFFSKEHKLYITSQENALNINNISYKAELNNYLIETECFVNNNNIETELSLLFVVKPEQISEGGIFLPYYIASINSVDELLDIQYYSAEAIFTTDEKTSKYIETEIIDTVKINFPYIDKKTNTKNYILIGFMLDEFKQNILN